MGYDDTTIRPSPAGARQQPPVSGPAAGHLHLSLDDERIAWLAVDRRDRGANTLSEALLAELDQRLAEAQAVNPAGLVIYSAKTAGFIAGADIDELSGLADEGSAFAKVRQGQAVMDRIEALALPTVALIHGFCLGGGTELALACRYRVARDDPGTRIGLPEVRLGIHPGFGGTLRLPRLVGPAAAMDMMLRGSTVGARAAARMGLVDHAQPQRHLARAARHLVRTDPGRHRASRLQRLPGQGPLRRATGAYLKHSARKRARPDHYPAPYALIDLWARREGDSEQQAAAEARSVARLLTGDTAQNLIRAFRLQERLKGLGRGTDFQPARVHVAGAGVMGGDIAAWCALNGLQVSLQDQSAARIAPAVGRARDLFEKRLRERRRVTAAMDRLTPDVRGDGAARADVVIEAIFEDGDAKRSLYGELEPRMRPDALLATNTSSIPLEELAEGLARPERLVGMHFFNPVAKMQLVEVVSGTATAHWARDRAAALTRTIERLPVTVTSAPGFLVNRLLMPYMLEAMLLVDEGAAATAVDRTAEDFGMRMGPVALADWVGLDICLSVAEILTERFGGTVPEGLRRRVAQGKLGRKSGEGFYRYRKGRPRKGLRRPRASPGLQDRLILAMLNEAVRCLREGVVADGDLLDGALIFGAGFAPHLGGPMHYATARGPAALEGRLERLARTYGERFRPDAGWQQLTGPQGGSADPEAAA